MRERTERFYSELPADDSLARQAFSDDIECRISSGEFDHLLTGDDWWEIRKGASRINRVRFRLHEHGPSKATPADIAFLAAVRKIVAPEVG